MGFSVFSIIEILYFLSIRPYFRYLRDSKKRRQTIERLTQRFRNIQSTNTNQSKDHAIVVENAILTHLN